jgi:1-deoxy-D-xylulose-5-phosphate synthase
MNEPQGGNTAPHYPLLSHINVPADLRRLDRSQLPEVSAEVREFLIDVISKIGGHFGAGLGTVELAVALHYVFQTPVDRVIWDVGHQAYPHKILTGRKNQLAGIRQMGGISGFLKREESEYDVFGAGHASTSLSAALGIAAARDFAKKDFHVVGVIGDGAMTGGMAYEAMNNIGMLKKRVIVILNDNGMSIAPNVWAISNFFTEIMSTRAVRRFKGRVWELTGKMEELGDRLRQIAGHVEEGVKAVLTPGVLFEALGFKYYGPVDGHHVLKIVEMLERVKEIEGPVLLHVSTQKGKGFAPAEADTKQNLHAVTPFNKITGKSLAKVPDVPPPPTYTKVFGMAMSDIARTEAKLVGITAAMPDGTGLDIFQREFPERFFDVGIAEQHGVTFAAGLATEGYIPVAAIYSTFLQRAFDQVIHDVCIQNLHVVFALDRGGLVGADGATHHGVFDLAYLRLIPNMVVMAPKDESELRDMLFTAVRYHGPIALRYPRGTGIGVPMKAGFDMIPIGTGEIVRAGRDVAIVAIGAMVRNTLQAAEILAREGIEAEVVNARFVKPLDTRLLDMLCARFTDLVTVEDGTIVGGFGSAIVEYVSAHHPHVRVHVHGIPDRFIEHGTPDQLYEQVDLHPVGIAAVVKRACASDSSRA